MAELENLEQEELDEKMLTVGPSPAAKLPEVPADSLVPEQQKASKVKHKADEDNDLAELEAWVAN